MLIAAARTWRAAMSAALADYTTESTAAYTDAAVDYVEAHADEFTAAAAALFTATIAIGQTHSLASTLSGLTYTNARFNAAADWYSATGTAAAAHDAAISGYDTTLYSSAAAAFATRDTTGQSTYRDLTNGRTSLNHTLNTARVDNAVAWWSTFVPADLAATIAEIDSDETRGLTITDGFLTRVNSATSARLAGAGSRATAFVGLVRAFGEGGVQATSQYAMETYGSTEDLTSAAGAEPADSTGSPTGTSGGATPFGDPGANPQLPAEVRGTWPSGTPGQGEFVYDDVASNGVMAGKSVNFDEGNIGIGAFPAEFYWRGDVAAASVDIPEVFGDSRDPKAADAEMRKRNPGWERPAGYDWHHAGPPGSKRMELLNEDAHSLVHHQGPAKPERAARRLSRLGRVAGAVGVYLDVKDALTAAGAIDPHLETNDAPYYFLDGDSVFTVTPGGWFSDPRRDFIAGPKAGTAEVITDEDVDAHRREAERLYGTYFPGNLFNDPSFSPGVLRDRLDYIGYDVFGRIVEHGYLDMHGLHRFSLNDPLNPFVI